MKEAIEKSLTGLSREKLEEALLKIIPDLPEEIKAKIGFLEPKQIISLIVEAIEKKLQSIMGDGFMVYIVKESSYPFCFDVKETKLESPNKVLGNDAAAKALCLRIPKFIKEKGGVESLSDADKKAMRAIQKEAAATIAERHPQINRNFAGFQLAEDPDKIFLRFAWMKTHKFGTLQKLGDTLKKRGIPPVVINSVISSMDKAYETLQKRQ